MNPESRQKRTLFLFLAVAISLAYTWFIFSFLAPASVRPGIDENAYLVGGKNIAQHFTTGFKPTDDYQFVGAMFVRTSGGWYYPKYPFGLLLLNSIPVLFHHRDCAFAISPLCTGFAALGMFFLARGIVGSFYGLLAMIALAAGPVTLQLAIAPNSHAPSLGFVVWGMYFLLYWWRAGRWQIGVIAGLLLGFAVTVRYSEALLLFPLYTLELVKPGNSIGPMLVWILKVIGLLPLGPIGIAALSRVKWKSWRSYFAAAVPVFAWGVPVTALVLFNRFSMGRFTGYDDTNESTGFSIDNFFQKWDFTIVQLYLFGAFVFLPLAVGGIVLMYRNTWRTALLLTLWFVPGAVLYTAYYWGGDEQGIAYLRFFGTLFPPLIIAAMWMMRSTELSTKGAIAAPLAAGLLTAIAASVGMWTSLGSLERDHRGAMNLHYSAERIIAHTKHSPPKPMILADMGMFPQLLQYMQFMLDADWYASDVFAPHMGGGFGIVGSLMRKPDASAPDILQRARINYIDSVRKGKSQADYVRDEQQLMDQAFAASREVFAVLLTRDAEAFRKRYINANYQMIELERWAEPCDVNFPGGGRENWLAMPVWMDERIIPAQPQQRVMFQIRPAPATRPTTQKG